MKVNMKEKIILLLFLVFFISSCAPSDQPITNDEIYVGSEGLRMKFLPHMPPPTVYYMDGETNEIPIMIEVHNVGASPTIANFYLSGYDPTLIKIKGIDPGRPTAAECDFNINYFRDFSRIGFDCNWGSFLFGSSGNDWWNRISFNNVPWFEQICRMGTNFENEDGNICSWLGNMDINLERSSDGTWSIQSLNDNLGVIWDSTGPATRFIVKGALIIGGFADKFAKTEVIMGKSNEYRQGERAIIDFSGWMERYPEGARRDFEQPLMLTACYYYTTVATPTICVDPNPYSTERKPCISQTTQGLKTQGAPVAITRIDQETTPKKIIFNIEVRNIGKGSVFDFAKINTCSPFYNRLPNPNEKNRVYIEDIRLSGVQLKCTPSREIMLFDGVGRIQCEFDTSWTDNNAAYETPLFIVLSYAYRQEELIKIKIKDIS